MSTSKASESTETMMQQNPTDTPSKQGSPELQKTAQWLAVVQNKLEENKKMLEAVLPKGYTPERFITTAYVYVRGKKELWGVAVNDLMTAFLGAAQQGLDFALPNEAHIVKFANSCSLIRGYKGDLKLARRSPQLKYIEPFTVCSNDTYRRKHVDQGTEISHELPEFGKPRGEIIGFYAKARDIHGNLYHEEMTNEEIVEHFQRFTKAKDKGPFAGIGSKGNKADNFEAYGLKTVLIRLCYRKLDLTTEMGFAPEWEGPKTGGEALDAPVVTTSAIGFLSDDSSEEPEDAPISE